MTPQTLTLIDKSELRFYVNTEAPFPKFRDFLGGFNLFAGPVPYAGMTHREFVESTRPNKLYSSVGITPGEALKGTVLAFVQSKAFELLRKGALALRDAKTEAEKKSIQARIERELAALRGDIK